MIKTTSQNKAIIWTPYLATAYAEGFCEGENATAEEQIQAYQYLIDNNLITGLQGHFGRTANMLIEQGLCFKKKGGNYKYY